MSTREKPQTTQQQTPEKRPSDKSPENDLRKASQLLRSARAKYIKAGDETKGQVMLETINTLQKLAEG